MELRLLQPTDIVEAVELSAAAGWNQTPADWRMLLDLAPESCFGIEADGCLASTATLLPLGSELAWLGMVLTRRDYQHQGFAKRLVAQALETAERMGIGTIGLDATGQGQPIYAAAGFVAGPAIERWSANLTAEPATSSQTPGPDWQDRIAALDRRAFGADRGELLRALRGNSQRIEVTEQGYALARSGRQANYLGPCVAKTPAAARELIGSCLSGQIGHQIEHWVWDLFPGNSATAELAASFGFQPVRHLVRMYRGKPPQSELGLIHAAAGFELG